MLHDKFLNFFFSMPNVVYLDIDKQKNLGFRTAQLLPENSYTRKNIGYLYAIQVCDFKRALSRLFHRRVFAGGLQSDPESYEWGLSD